MSKTIRRKHAKAWCEKDTYVELDDGIYSIGCFNHRLYFEYNNWKELTKEIAVFHSDSYLPWPGTPDKDFRRLYGHKKDRQDARRKLYKEKHALEYGNEVFNKPNNIDWEWY